MRCKDLRLGKNRNTSPSTYPSLVNLSANMPVSRRFSHSFCHCCSRCSLFTSILWSSLWIEGLQRLNIDFWHVHFVHSLATGLVASVKALSGTANPKGAAVWTRHLQKNKSGPATLRTDSFFVWRSKGFQHSWKIHPKLQLLKLIYHDLQSGTGVFFCGNY